MLGVFAVAASGALIALIALLVSTRFAKLSATNHSSR